MNVNLFSIKQFIRGLRVLLLLLHKLEFNVRNVTFLNLPAKKYIYGNCSNKRYMGDDYF